MSLRVQHNHSVALGMCVVACMLYKDLANRVVPLLAAMERNMQLAWSLLESGTVGGGGGGGGGGGVGGGGIIHTSFAGIRDVDKPGG